MDKEKIKNEIREAAVDLLGGVKLVSALFEMEYPGHGHLVFDVLAEEVDKLRKSSEPEEGSTEPPAQANELMQTVAMMGSEDYKERFKAEYYQTKIRYDKLHAMCVKYEAGTLDFTPTCSLELLKEQKAVMGNYLRCLEVRAEIESIKL